MFRDCSSPPCFPPSFAIGGPLILPACLPLHSSTTPLSMRAARVSFVRIAILGAFLWRREQYKLLSLSEHLLGVHRTGTLQRNQARQEHLMLASAG